MKNVRPGFIIRMCPDQDAWNYKYNPINDRSGKKCPKIYMDRRYNKIEYSAGR
jgi:hypothetical protein